MWVLGICMDVWMYVWMYVCMDGCMYGWMYGCMYVWMDGWMDGWIDLDFPNNRWVWLCLFGTEWLLAAFSRTAHPNNITLNTDLHWVLNNTPASAVSSVKLFVWTVLEKATIPEDMQTSRPELVRLQRARFQWAHDKWYRTTTIGLELPQYDTTMTQPPALLNETYPNLRLKTGSTVHSCHSNTAPPPRETQHWTASELSVFAPEQDEKRGLWRRAVGCPPNHKWETVLYFICYFSIGQIFLFFLLFIGWGKTHVWVEVLFFFISIIHLTSYIHQLIFQNKLSM